MLSTTQSQRPPVDAGALCLLHLLLKCNRCLQRPMYCMTPVSSFIGSIYHNAVTHRKNMIERHARSRMSLGFETNRRAPLSVSFKPYILLTCYFRWGGALAKAKEGQKESRKNNFKGNRGLIPVIFQLTSEYNFRASQRHFVANIMHTTYAKKKFFEPSPKEKLIPTKTYFTIQLTQAKYPYTSSMGGTA